MKKTRNARLSMASLFTMIMMLMNFRLVCPEEQTLLIGVIAEVNSIISLGDPDNLINNTYMAYLHTDPSSTE